MKYAALFLGACLLGAAAGAAFAATQPTATRKAELAGLRARIDKLQAASDADVRRRGEVYGQLRTSEQQIAGLSNALRTLENSLTQAQGRLAKLKQQDAQVAAGLATQKTALARELRSAYIQGRAPELDMLLNAQDPATLDRMLAYYGYLNRARTADIEALRASLARLAALNRKLQAEVTMLAGLKQRRSTALAELESSRDQRQQSLAALDTRIRGRQAKLAEMRRDARNLEDLLANLQQTLSDIPVNLEGEHRFVRLKGKLPWPVSGHIVQRFGAPLADGRLHAQGDLIAAPLGTPVHAIAWGRVVFSDWLPHFGLLVIIDHGDGYMSIYAHNQTVYVKVGDWVQMGETIATLGDSGGQNRPALYFEIRHLKAALRPQDWCR
ncbi:MAG: murein hydrolase activator EnvC family protein [Gammaproteobacteria bacterium]